MALFGRMVLAVFRFRLGVPVSQCVAMHLRNADWNVLCIGIDDYILGARPLRYCVRDAEAVFQSWARMASGSWHQIHNPTSAELHEAIAAFVKTGKKLPKSFLFFSGHSYQFNGQLWMKAPDADTFAADVCVEEVCEQLCENAFFICIVTDTLQDFAPRLFLVAGSCSQRFPLL